jgi:selenocysteine-specific elongation factor
VFSKTKFADSIEFIPVSALENINIDKLINKLVENTKIPKRDTSGKFVFLIDHCFNIKGKGTVGISFIINKFNISDWNSD